MKPANAPSRGISGQFGHGDCRQLMSPQATKKAAARPQSYAHFAIEKRLILC